MSDLEAVIGESLEDAVLPEETSSTESVDLSTSEDPTPTPDPAPEPVSTDPTPGANKPVEVDPFESKYGIPSKALGGRENRIPYSRVKKITQNAVNEIAETALGRKVTPQEADKVADLVKAHVAKLPELETRVKDYETRLNSYQGFEQIMVNDAPRHLQMLSTLPAYKQFFSAVEAAFTRLDQLEANPQSQGQTPAQTQILPGDPMPRPNQKLSDGSMVYDEEGLKNLMDWQARQVEARITNRIQERYAPIEHNWQVQQRIEAVRPTVERQIAEARTWDKFNENEAEIVKVLQQFPQLSLEAAYHKVVDPKIRASWEEERSKLVADRNKIREEVLAELKQAPKATSAPSSSARTTPPASTGPRRLEDVIAEQIKGLK